MSAYLENINISRGHALASTALILSVLAILFAVSMRATPCVSAASGSCSVGETETFAGTLALGTAGDIEYEGATDDDYETTLTVTDPTADRTITFPDASGTVALAGGGAATVPEGGTGQTTLAADGVLIGNGTGGITVTAAGNAGEVLTSNGAGSDPTYQAAGGTVHIDQWRYTGTATGDQEPITSWEQNDTNGFSVIGAGMTESSGVFTFPDTGVWAIRFYFMVNSNGDVEEAAQGFIQTTTDFATGPTWDDHSRCTLNALQVWSVQSSCTAEAIFNVVDVASEKVRFSGTSIDNGNGLSDSSTMNRTAVVFHWIGNP